MIQIEESDKLHKIHNLENVFGKILKSTDEALEAGLPKRFILEKVNVLWDKTKRQLTYFTPETFIKRNAIVPAEIEVIERYDKYAQKTIERFNKHVQENLGQYTSILGYTIGTDPEIFVTDDKDRLIPAFEFLPNNKNARKTAKYLQNIYKDGFAVEFNVMPNTCQAYMMDSVQDGLLAALNNARAYNPKAKLSIQNVFEVPFEELQKAKDEDVEFGCAPSKNAYGLKGNLLSGREVPYRSAGGHIHFGVGKRTEEEYIRMVKAMDAILAVCCVSFYANFDNPIRRNFYGLVGEYRTPKHGLEYRVLSNAWLAHPSTGHLTLDLARKSLNFGFANLMHLWQAAEEETIETVMSSNVKHARTIMERNKSIIIELLNAYYREKNVSEMGYKAFLNGVESIVRDPTAIEKNWRLSGVWNTHSNNDADTWRSAVNKTLSSGKLL